MSQNETHGDDQPRFEVAKTYDSNRRGEFTVISLKGDDMTVKWEDNGEMVMLSASEQEKILRNYEKEFVKDI